MTLEFSDGPRVPLRDELNLTGGESEQLEQRFEGRQVPLLGRLDMPEVDQLADRRRGQLGQLCGVELLARDGEHEITGVHQRGQDDYDPFGLQAIALLGCKVLDTIDLLDEF